MATSKTKNLLDNLSQIFSNSIQKLTSHKPKKARKIRRRLIRKRKRSNMIPQKRIFLTMMRRQLKNKRRYKLNIRKKLLSKDKHPKR